MRWCEWLGCGRCGGRAVRGEAQGDGVGEEGVDVAAGVVGADLEAGDEGLDEVLGGGFAALLEGLPEEGGGLVQAEVERGLGVDAEQMAIQEECAELSGCEHLVKRLSKC